MVEFSSWNNYQHFRNSITSESRFIFSEEIENFLRALINTSKDRIVHLKKDSILWRAQLGNDWKPEYFENETINEHPCPYPPNRMKPVKNSATEGRANPKGIPCLYAASDKSTAMSEVRPWLGTLVSVGQFSINKDLTLIDFSVGHGEEEYFIFREPSGEEKVKAVWSHIDNAFSKPVTESDLKSEYAPTQIIAEYIKSKGYDGIVYKSSLAAGYNIALFDLESANLVNCFIYQAKSLSLEFAEFHSPYFVRNEN